MRFGFAPRSRFNANSGTPDSVLSHLHGHSGKPLGWGAEVKDLSLAPLFLRRLLSNSFLCGSPLKLATKKEELSSIPVLSANRSYLRASQRGTVKVQRLCS